MQYIRITRHKQVGKGQKPLLNPEIMFTKITAMRILLFVLFFYSSQNLYADEKVSMLISCNASVTGIPGVQDSSFMKEVTLTGSQLSPEGKKLLGAIGQYEFWVETNLMSLLGKPQIMDFVTKIKDQKTGETYQAISGRHPVNDGVMTGKVSVVTYETDGKTEKKSLILDCLTHDVPSKPDLHTIPVK